MFKAILLTFALSGIEQAKHGDYEAALPLLDISEQVIPKELHHQYYFYRAVAAHQTLQKKEALASLKKFWDSFGDPPKRYAYLAEGMENDLNKWGNDPLVDITRKMGDVSRRLELSKGGSITQRKQKEIVEDLEKLIKEQENPNHGKSEAQEREAQRNKQAQAQSGIKQPAPESIIMGGGGKGNVDINKKLNNIAQQWGSMPPDKRAQVVKELTQQVPPRFEQMVKNYFEALDKLPLMP